MHGCGKIQTVIERKERKHAGRERTEDGVLSLGGRIYYGLSLPKDENQECLLRFPVFSVVFTMRLMMQAL